MASPTKANIEQQSKGSLAALYGWDDTNSTFRAVAVDSTGKLQITV